MLESLSKAFLFVDIDIFDFTRTQTEVSAPYFDLVYTDTARGQPSCELRDVPGAHLAPTPDVAKRARCFAIGREAADEVGAMRAMLHMEYMKLPGGCM